MFSIAHSKRIFHTLCFLNSRSVKNNKETYLSNMLKGRGQIDNTIDPNSLGSIQGSSSWRLTKQVFVMQSCIKA